MLIQDQTDDFIVRSAPLKSKSFRSDNELSQERNGAEQEQDNTDLDLDDPDPDPNIQSSSY